MDLPTARKRPLSTCDEVSLCQSRASSTFQRFASSKFTAARPSRWRKSRLSSAASTSTRSGISDAGDDTPVSCVTRETSCDGCEFNRFMVWVAVKRNQVVGITPEQRLECPLVKCRKQFLNHELMLQHVYGCDWLGMKVYWCYDCQREERFEDARCKTCSGHPARFRKLFSLSKYKTLFSSMGRKSRKEPGSRQRHDSCLSLNSYQGTTAAQRYGPSWSFNPVPPSAQAELSSQAEILELDSKEVPSWPFSSDEDEHEEVDIGQHSYGASNAMDNADRLEPLAAELDSMPTTGLWHLSDVATRKPVLSVNTLFQAQEKAKTRSVKLAPSSSVRSNASGNSYMTNASGNSFLSSTMESCCLSPTMSSWSGQWNSCLAGADSSLASPISPLDQLAGSFQASSDFCIPPAAGGEADQILRGITSVSHPAASLNIPTTLQFGPARSAENSVDISSDDSPQDSLGSGQGGKILTPPPEHTSSKQPPRQTSADGLAKHAFQLLQTHVTVSKETLRDMPRASRSVSDQFLELDALKVASKGYACLKALVERQHQTDAVNLLCAVHVAMAWVVALDEADGPGLSKAIAAQAHRYSSWVSLDTRDEYHDIIDSLWELGEWSAKGQHRDSEGPIVGVARLFLDRMDYLVLKAGPDHMKSTARIDGVKASELRDLHGQVTNKDPTKGFEAAFASMVNILAQEYGQNNRHLVAALDKGLRLFRTGSISWTRRIEIELVNAGLYHLPLGVVVSKYGPFIRRQLESLFANVTPRSTYYALLFAAIEGRSRDLSAPTLTPPSPNLDSDLAPESDSPRVSAAPVDGGHGLDMFSHLPVSDASFKLQASGSPDDLLADIPDHDFSPFLPNTIPAFPQTMLAMTDSPPNLLTATWQGTDSLLHLDSLLPFPEDAPGFQHDTPLQIPANSTAPSPSNGGTSAKSATATEERSAGHTRTASDPRREHNHRPPKKRRVSPQGEAAPKGPRCSFPGCDYQPNGDPKWWKGSMDKHIKNQHSSASKIYKCDYPGCKSEFKNRQDNLKAHKKEKGHWTDRDGRPLHKATRASRLRQEEE